MDCLPLCLSYPFLSSPDYWYIKYHFWKNTLPILNTLLRTLNACDTRCVGFSLAKAFRDTVIEYCSPAPSPATLLLGNCYHGTISGPAQPLVSTSVGSSPKQATLSEQLLVILLNHQLAPEWGPFPTWATVKETPFVAHSANSQRSGGRQAETELRERSWPSPQGPPAHLASGQGCQGTGWGLCPAGLHCPRQGQPLDGPRPWGRGEPLPHPRLCDILTAAVPLGRSLWDLPPLWAAWGACGHLGLGHLAPSAMMAGQSLGNLPFLIRTK